jgi:carbon-monoxide dehydrogenase small subunit
MEVATIEGFDHDPVMGELREAFTREHGLQCGFCTPGMLIAARDIVLRLPGADERRIREELSGNLCRCTGYVGIVDAVASVLDRRRRRAGAPAAQAPAPARAGLAPFTPRAAAAEAAPVAAAAVAREEEQKARQGWTRFEESFVIGEPRARVWELFGDVARVAACLPGAQLVSFDGRTVKGRMTAKLGPITASFAGSAVIERDPAAWSGTIVGAGSDGATGSRTKGEIAYRLQSIEQDAATRVDVTVLYSLQGALAQFSRSGVAQEFARRLTGQFAVNLAGQLAGASASGGGAADAAGASHNVGRLLWSMLKARIRRLLGRRR